MENIEIIDLDLELFEEIEKINSKFNFPVVVIGGRTIYFNKAAAPYIPKKFKWRVSDEWCVLVPAELDDGFAYVYTPSANGGGGGARFPAEIQSSFFRMRGVHKLYKTKHGGVCFKRYETIGGSE